MGRGREGDRGEREGRRQGRGRGGDRGEREGRRQREREGGEKSREHSSNLVVPTNMVVHTNMAYGGNGETQLRILTTTKDLGFGSPSLGENLATRKAWERS